MSIYERLGVRRVINGQFALTRLGGSTLSSEVLEAMSKANENWAWLWELEEQAGKTIAQLIGAQAAHITCGAFAGLVISASACIAGKDPERISRLPDTTGMKNEIIIQKCIRSMMYDRSMEVPGGKMVVVGGDKDCSAEQIESAINEKTAAIHYLAGGDGPWWWDDGSRAEIFQTMRRRPVPIEDVVKIGKSHGIPIIVDAAGKTWPMEGLTKYVAAGCDYVAYGGKYVLGPQSTGFIAGRQEMVEIAALHSFVGYESGPGVSPGFYRGIGRGYKLDRQEIVGLVVALERWMKMNHEKERIQPAYEKCDVIIDSLKSLPNISIDTVPKKGDTIPYHRLSLVIDVGSKAPNEAANVKNELMNGNPSIWIDAMGTKLIINTLFLNNGEEKVIADRLRSLLRGQM